MADERVSVFSPGIVGPDEPGDVMWFVFRKRDLLVTSTGQLPSKAELDRHTLSPDRSLYIGDLDGKHCYAAQVAENADNPEGLEYKNLMMLYASLDSQIHSLAGRAVQLIEWDRTHEICGACGAKTEPSKIDRSRACLECGLPQFPRLSPAVIMTVERGDEILLARSPHFPPGMFSTLAGFVEPGESAEEAVAREIGEEVGVAISSVRYFSSQPWPFPNNLMLGYIAEWESGDIKIDEVEIEEARWFHCDDMPQQMPGNISISQWLIDDFVRRRRGA